MRGIRKLDVFPKFDRKFEQDARQRTVSGGLFSLAALAVVLLLVVSEVRYFLSVEERHEMYVDPAMGGVMPLTVNITFHRVPCDLIAIDAIDAFGIYADGVAAKAVKTSVDAESLRPLRAARRLVDGQRKATVPIDPSGAAKENCPSCYGAEQDPGDCCHTCDEVRMAYERKGWRFSIDDVSVEQCAAERVRLAATAASREGCNIYSTFSVARVTGSLHFIPGRAFHALGRRMHDLMGETVNRLNLTHTIHALEFGRPFPGQRSPLDGWVATPPPDAAVAGRFSYFVKLVPTRFQSASALLAAAGSAVDSNQYAVTQHYTARAGTAKEGEAAGGGGGSTQDLLPGVFVTYDLSPIMIHVARVRPYPSVVHLALQLCAVSGGVLTVAGLVDAMLFHGMRRLKKKEQLGKLA